MTTFKYTDHWHLAGITLLVTGALLFWPLTGLALEPCPNTAQDICESTFDGDHLDCDQDGFTNYQECSGFPTEGDKIIAGYLEDVEYEPDRLNPAEPDLFFIAGDLNGDPLPEASLMLQALGSVQNNALKIYADGLRVHTHLITKFECGDDRLITGTTKAAMIRESLSTEAEGTYLGSTPQSIPSDPYVSSVIYTQKIKNNVDLNCPGGTECSINDTLPLVTNLDGTNNSPIINYYILQVISHEMGHGSQLAPTDERSYFHYRRSNTVMDPAATFKRGVYTIPTNFDMTQDPQALTLQSLDAN